MDFYVGNIQHIQNQQRQAGLGKIFDTISCGKQDYVTTKINVTNSFK